MDVYGLKPLVVPRKRERERAPGPPKKKVGRPPKAGPYTHTEHLARILPTGSPQWQTNHVKWYESTLYREFPGGSRFRTSMMDPPIGPPPDDGPSSLHAGSTYILRGSCGHRPARRGTLKDDDTAALLVAAVLAEVGPYYLRINNLYMSGGDGRMGPAAGRQRMEWVFTNADQNTSRRPRSSAQQAYILGHLYVGPNHRFEYGIDRLTIELLMGALMWLDERVEDNMCESPQSRAGSGRPLAEVLGPTGYQMFQSYYQPTRRVFGWDIAELESATLLGGERVIDPMLFKYWHAGIEGKAATQVWSYKVPFTTHYSITLAWWVEQDPDLVANATAAAMSVLLDSDADAGATARCF